MKLSIIIVNYNVRYFLEQCLSSVNLAIGHAHVRNPQWGIEVFVVDNNSVDDSNEMVLTRFPEVKLIANKENLGFSKANNQAMKVATGEFILLLNPDTVVQESTFEKVIEFMDQHPEAGGLGVHMVDGNGKFLPESKRGLPTPAVSFYKIFGISRVFKKSARFNQYHLGHLTEDQNHEVDILSGAFMLMRKSVLDKIGLLDEAFFMYGEDIDLSWRIRQAGYKNFYFADTTIIHYKGESTKKGSLNYVYVFYNAMVIFAQKHFSQQNARLFSWFINMAIWLRALVAIAVRFVKSSLVPLLDIALLFGIWQLSTQVYANSRSKIYDDSLVLPLLLSFSSLWAVVVFFGGGYDKPYRPTRVIKPVMAGAAIMLTAYSLLPETMRFSRAMMLIGTAVALLVFFGVRWILQKVASQNNNPSEVTGIVGSDEEIARVQQMFHTASRAEGIVRIAVDCNSDRLREYITVHKLGRLVFCARDIASSQIIGLMTAISDMQIEMKIAPPESLFMIGSSSIEKSGEMAIVDVNSMTLPKNKRWKRLVDVSFSVFCLIIWPLTFWGVNEPVQWLKNSFSVILGRKTWVGPDLTQFGAIKLAKAHLKPAIIHPAMVAHADRLSPDAMAKINTLYVKDYSPWRDLHLLFTNVSRWGNGIA